MLQQCWYELLYTYQGSSQLLGHPVELSHTQTNTDTYKHTRTHTHACTHTHTHICACADCPGASCPVYKWKLSITEIHTHTSVPAQTVQGRPVWFTSENCQSQRYTHTDTNTHISVPAQTVQGRPVRCSSGSCQLQRCTHTHAHAYIHTHICTCADCPRASCLVFKCELSLLSLLPRPVLFSSRLPVLLT